MNRCTVLQAYHIGVIAPFQPPELHGNPFCPVHEPKHAAAWSEGWLDTKLDFAAICLGIRPKLLSQFSLEQVAAMAASGHASSARSAR